MPMQRSHLCDTPAEELASVITHALAAILSIIGLVAMVLVSNGEPLRVISACIFGICLNPILLTVHKLHIYPDMRDTLWRILLIRSILHILWLLS